MKKLRTLVVAVLAFTAFYSCDSKDEVAENQAPSKAKLTYPAENAENVEVTPTFKWEASIDPEKSKVTYELYVSKDDKFTKENTISAVDIQENSYTFGNQKLAVLTKYYWKVVASDKDKLKSESDVHTFTTLDKDLRINLLTPTNNTEIENHQVKLTWEVKRNAVYTKEVTYDIYIRNGSAEFSNALKTGLTETEYNLNDLKGNATYYWSVKAMDGQDVVAESEVFTFSTPNTLPTPATIKENPKQTLTDDKVSIVFEWKASVDPDRIFENGVFRDEKLTYDFYLSTSNNFTEADIKASALAELTYTITGLDPETKYYIKIITKDENEGIAESQVMELTTKKIPTTGSITLEEGTWTDSRDSKEYKTITINGKTWLAENFAYIPYVEQEDSEGNKKVCSVYGVENPADVNALKASDNYKKFGVLYNTYTFGDIVPTGWRVATDEDWKELEKLSGMEEGQINTTGYKNRGEAMHKFIMQGQPFDVSKASEPTNEIGTSVTYGGYYKEASFKGGFRGEDEYTYIWTSTEKSSYGSLGNYQRAFSKKRKAVERNIASKNYRMYVRLVKE